MAYEQTVCLSRLIDDANFVFLVPLVSDLGSRSNFNFDISNRRGGENLCNLIPNPIDINLCQMVIKKPRGSFFSFLLAILNPSFLAFPLFFTTGIFTIF